MWTILDIYHYIIIIIKLYCNCIVLLGIGYLGRRGTTWGGGGCLKFFNMLNVHIALVQNFEDINEDIFFTHCNL